VTKTTFDARILRVPAEIRIFSTHMDQWERLWRVSGYRWLKMFKTFAKTIIRFYSDEKVEKKEKRPKVEKYWLDWMDYLSQLLTAKKYVYVFHLPITATWISAATVSSPTFSWRSYFPESHLSAFLMKSTVESREFRTATCSSKGFPSLVHESCGLGLPCTKHQENLINR